MERHARRAQVLRHAKRIFARKGYHRTNVADIIARAHRAWLLDKRFWHGLKSNPDAYRPGAKNAVA